MNLLNVESMIELIVDLKGIVAERELSMVTVKLMLVTLDFTYLI